MAKTSGLDVAEGCGSTARGSFCALVSALLASKGGAGFVAICLVILALMAGFSLQRELHTAAREGAEAFRPGMIAAYIWAVLGVALALALVFLRVSSLQISSAVARKMSDNRAEFLAYFDPPTGLANRFQFEDQLAKTIAGSDGFAIMLVDIDRFREFNNRFGRLTGDTVIKAVGHRVQQVADEYGAFAARLTSDDFVLILNVTDRNAIEDAAAALLERCARPITRAAQVYSVSVSIGCAPSTIAAATEQVSQTELMGLADLALDSARTDGEGRLVIFDEALRRRLSNKKALLETLPHAIQDRELQVFFQPKFDMERNAIIGFEALVRWTHEGEPVPPSTLISVAEAGGLICDLDRYMLTEVVQIIAGWNRKHRTEIAVSVNVSAMLVRTKQIQTILSALLRDHQLRPGLLTIEVTESMELDPNGADAKTIAEVRDLGVRVSIDDFGTGYSSFGYLRHLAIDEVKIDRSLVLDIECHQSARDVLKTVVGLPSCLGHSVVVEGIETEKQANIARDLGVRVVQGYFFGRPRPARDWLAEETYRKNPSKLRPEGAGGVSAESAP